MGSYCAQRFRDEQGAQVWLTTRTPEKCAVFSESGYRAFLVDFDKGGSDVPGSELAEAVFDMMIISVPVTRKDDLEAIRTRFANLAAFVAKLRFKQAVFFGSVGIYPAENALIREDSYPDAQLEQRLLYGEQTLRSVNSGINILRLGGLFGLNRIFAKYFQGKVCATGDQTANFVHVEDIYGVVVRMMETGVAGATYNLVSPEHPLKKDVLVASAAKYGFGLPSGYDDSDKTAKRVSPDRLIQALNYRFIYHSPVDF